MRVNLKEMELARLINHPELLNRDTLFELRSMLALHPYFQTARLLMLQNLYLLHDPSFDEELQRAAIYITDRKTIFNMVEAAHYQLHQSKGEKQTRHNNPNRTVALIDSFLDNIPPEQPDDEQQPRRKPTQADATVDYVAYLMQMEATEQQKAEDQPPHMKGQDLIDNFLEQKQGRLVLNEQPKGHSEEPPIIDNPLADNNEEEYFTETLARIYIKQGRYQKALDIIGRLSEKYPHKNNYFADQIRFLEKLIINSNKNKN